MMHITTPRSPQPAPLQRRRRKPGCGLLLGRSLTLLASVVFCAAVHAQAYPSKPVRLVVGFPPGGLADLASRTVADQLSGLWKQQVIVENRSGASGAIAAEQVARAPADGYTLLVVMPDHVILPAVRTRLPFDPVKDFRAVSLLGVAPLLLLANPKVAADSLPDLVALAKSRPGALTYSTPGSASLHHLSQELMNATLGIKMTHVPYKGGGPAMIDTIGGVVDLTLGSPAQALQQVQEGKLKALGVASSTRLPMLPNVPTVAESAIPRFTAGLWVGVLAPADTPADRVQRISTDISRVMQAPKVLERLGQLGVEVIASTPAQFDAHMADEATRWGQVVKQANVTAD